jgi:hypothetical protein
LARDIPDAPHEARQHTRSQYVLPVALTTQVLQEKSWTPEVVERRQQALLQRLQEIWRL